MKSLQHGVTLKVIFCFDERDAEGYLLLGTEQQLKITGRPEEVLRVLADRLAHVPLAGVVYGPKITERFVECATCAAKPGSPTLCEDCLRRRVECQR